MNLKNLNRYSRQIVLPEIGELGQEKLKAASVLVIGAGGLGCPVLQTLAGAGVGRVGIIDGDVVDQSNLHRQFLYTDDDCGKPKVDIASAAIKRLNPALKVETFFSFLSEDNAQIIEDFEVLVDCTDALSIRYLINDLSLYSQKPMVYASIHKFEGQVAVFNFNGGPSYRCLFPELENNKVPNCEEAGVLGALPNLLGMMQAIEVLKIILGIGDVLSGRLLHFDALNFCFNEISFSKNEVQIQKGLQNGKEIFLKQFASRAISPEQFLAHCQQSTFRIIDLREVHEMPKLNFASIIQMPYSEINENTFCMEKEEAVLLFCQSGKRSKQLMESLVAKGCKHVFHLARGLASLPIEYRK